MKTSNSIDFYKIVQTVFTTSKPFDCFTGASLILEKLFTLLKVITDLYKADIDYYKKNVLSSVKSYYFKISLKRAYKLKVK